MQILNCIEPTLHYIQWKVIGPAEDQEAGP